MLLNKTPNEALFKHNASILIKMQRDNLWNNVIARVGFKHLITNPWIYKKIRVSILFVSYKMTGLYINEPAGRKEKGIKTLRECQTSHKGIIPER